MAVNKSNIFDQNNKDLPVFGIDLGTTNSAISVVREKNIPTVIKLTSGKFTMPSCVMWKDGKFIVGDEAYAHRGEPNVINSIKRHMEDPDYVATFVDGDKELKMTPVEISAEILKGLVKQTDGKYGEVKDVIVTVPAYFSNIGRDNTKDACRLAGLNPINIINEPTAASMVYDIKDNDTILIYDLGGGTFDVTLARAMNSSSGSDLDDIYGLDSGDSDVSNEKSIEVIDTSGDSKLGGDDIDAAMYEHIKQRFLKEQNVDLDKTPEYYRIKIKRELIRMKNALDSQKALQKLLRYTSSYKDENGNEIVNVIDITITDFVAALTPIYLKTEKIVKKVLRENAVKPSTVVLVGGSTKHPMLREWIKKLFNDSNVDDGFNPDLSVAAGASVYGKGVKFGNSNVHIFDIVPQSIGVGAKEGMVPIISRKSVIPVSNSKNFTTFEDDQTTLDISIFQGDSANYNACARLGTLHIKNIPAKKAGEVGIVVTMAIDITNTLKITADVDGIVQELTLDLKGVESTDNNKIEQRIERWLDKALDYSDDVYNEVYELCEKYRHGQVEASKIIKVFDNANKQ